jgi:hypothetical protein
MVIGIILIGLSIDVAWRQVVFGGVILAAMWGTAERG